MEVDLQAYKQGILPDVYVQKRQIDPFSQMAADQILEKKKKNR